MRFVIKSVVLLLVFASSGWAQVRPQMDMPVTARDQTAITPIVPQTPAELAEQKAATTAEMLKLLAELDHAYAAHANLMQRLLSRVPADIQPEIQRSIDSVRQGRMEIDARRRRIVQSANLSSPRHNVVTRPMTPNATKRNSARVARSPAASATTQGQRTPSKVVNAPSDFDSQMQKARDNAASLRQIREEASKARDSFQKR